MLHVHRLLAVILLRHRRQQDEQAQRDHAAAGAVRAVGNEGAVDVMEQLQVIVV